MLKTKVVENISYEKGNVIEFLNDRSLAKKGDIGIVQLIVSVSKNMTLTMKNIGEMETKISVGQGLMIKIFSIDGKEIFVGCTNDDISLIRR